MLSILIPVYNYDARRLVKTLHQQAEKAAVPFEILLADDCSTDTDLKEKNKSLTHLSHCQFFPFKENKGRTATRQFLAEKASFNHLLFLDADVLPKNNDFIKKYINHIDTADLVFGGVSYENYPPESDKILRWKYGKDREAKSLENRQKTPYRSFISMAFFIRKSSFLETNNQLENLYGLDPIFSYKLKENNVTIRHIDNPIVHYGLESNEQFLKKSKKGLKTFAYLEKQGKIPKDFRPLQRAYIKLKKYHCTTIFSGLIKFFDKPIEKNLLSKNPSLFLFDLYRLGYLIELKKA